MNDATEPDASARADLPAMAVRAWLMRELPSRISGEVWAPELISGGLSNLTYRLPTEHGALILRRPPPGHLLPRAHDMLRECRVQRALARTAVPVPTVVALCTDSSVIGAPFYVMEEVVGEVLRDATDTQRLTPAVRASVADELAAAFVALHAVDPDAVGLGDYGRRDGYCARQIATWRRQWERSRTRDLPDMETLVNDLSELVPSDTRSTVVHGDFRLDNVVVDLSQHPRIAAVLDWELSTLGDPLADLGLTMTYWHDADDDERAQIPVAAGVTAMPGFPTARQFAERYGELSGTDLSGLGFYQALGAMKLAVILEGVHARYLSGTTVGAGYETAGSAVPLLAARGRRQVGVLRKQRM